MILRVASIAFAIAALAALWWGYGQLGYLRGSMFWDYRFVVFAVAAFLGLSALEWALGWLRHKVEGDQDNH